jgi:hypothetical protein
MPDTHEWAQTPVQDARPGEPDHWVGTCRCGDGWAAGSEAELRAAFDAHR